MRRNRGRKRDIAERPYGLTVPNGRRKGQPDPVTWQGAAGTTPPCAPAPRGGPPARATRSRRRSSRPTRSSPARRRRARPDPRSALRTRRCRQIVADDVDHLRAGLGTDVEVVEALQPEHGGVRPREILDVDEVAHDLALPVEGDRLLRQRSSDEVRDGVRLRLVQFVRAVGIEVAEDQRVHPVELVVRRDERLRRHLRRAVRVRLDAERVVLADRQALRRAVHGRARREHDLADVRRGASPRAAAPN